MTQKKIKIAYSQFTEKRSLSGLQRSLTPVALQKSPKIQFEGKEYINFSSNDYLGLRFNSEMIAQSIKWTEKFGCGVGASRLVTGNMEEYTAIERKIAKWKGFEDALIMNSGYQCNSGILPALFDKKILGSEPLVFSDRLIHASMHAGCIASGVRQIRFRHNDTEHLRQLLEKHTNDSKQTRPIFILTESIFSMDGDIAPLEELYKIRDEYEAFLIVDEAHACGVVGNEGKGLADRADLVIGTFGKALGCFGAYVACDKEIKDYLVNNCASLIYSTALPPSVIGTINACVDIVKKSDKERAYLQKISEYFRSELTASGFDTSNSQTQIVPVIIGDSAQALNISNMLRQEGFWASAIRPPTVPINSSRIRFTFSSAHEEKDVHSLIKIIKQIYLRHVNR